MRKKVLAGMLAMMMLAPAARADVYEGKTVAASSVSVEVEAGGILESLDVILGETVAEGDVIGSVRTTKVFAAQDGTVARLNVSEGDSVDGTVLEIMPVETYQIYCTVDNAYQSCESTLVHSGEQVYLKCTANGTHRGVGVITKIENDEYRVLAIGGEFYVGETVYLYRDEDFSTEQRIGKGTVVINDTEAYEASGTIARLHVSEGEYVERGELLYEITDSENTEIIAQASGIVTTLSAEQGDQLKAGQFVATIVPQDQICVEIRVDETIVAHISKDATVWLTFANDPNEESVSGSIIDISWIAEEEQYSVKVMPSEKQGLRLGMTVAVQIDD